MSTGPLAGVRIIEIAGIGPGPFAAMMLSDMGAEVIRVERTQAVRGPVPDGAHWDVMLRGRRNVAIDLKNEHGAETLLRLVEGADGLIEGFRPGVMERLGVGPKECLARKPQLVFGRMTGWGQSGPLATAAGHDINYIALAGALAHFARDGEAPVPPLNLVGDFGGGGLMLAFGMVCALFEARTSGVGQVVDAAMVDGSAALMTMFWAFKNANLFDEARPGTNLLDTGAHFYDVYRCRDGKYLSVGAIEPQFYALLLERLGLADDPAMAAQMDRGQWSVLKEKVASRIASKSRDEWVEIFSGTDACVAPVLSMSEAAIHPHNIERGTFIEVDGVVQPAPAPRFSRTTTSIPDAPRHPGQDTREVLLDSGFNEAEVDELVRLGAVTNA
jgi:alpha-methylacyl-CoA racemase